MQQTTNEAAFPDRHRLWAGFQSGPGAAWDVIVVGGGITGAGILRLAAQRGYRALLIEQGDYCWGTSSRSSKMVHGGLRYLAAGQLGLTRHALHEREWLLRELPGLVRRLSYCFPLYRGRFPPRFATGLLFWLYDRLARVDDHRRIDNAGLRRLFPHLDVAGLNGAYRYSDAVTDDARLVLRFLHEAVADGAAVRNYSRVSALIREQDQVVGVEVQDRVSGATCPLRAGVVINATGAWADRLPGQATSDVRIHPQRGSHLMLDARRFPVPIAIFLRHAADGRRVFVYPWEGRTVVGTTDINHAGDLDIAASITAAEVDYLLQAARPVFANRPPERQDVISTWSGVRPIIAGKKSTDPSRASREHRVWSEPGLVSCSGGKLTTFLQMARDVLKQVAATLPPPRPAAPDRLIRPVSLAPGDLGVPDPEQARRLLGRYGEAAQRLVTDAGPGELDVIEGTTCCPAELRFSLRNEGVVHLDDLMLRRSRLGLLLPDGGRAALGPVRRLAQESLAWDDARWQEELERYRQVIAGHYSLPATAAAGRG